MNTLNRPDSPNLVTRTSWTYLGLVALVSVTAGCYDADPSLDLDSDADAALEAAAEGRVVLRLADQEPSGMLYALDERISLVRAPTPEDALADLADVDAVSLDLDALADSELDGWVQVLRDAHSARKPVILENAREEQVAKAFGAGVDGRLLYITNDGGATKILVLASDVLAEPDASVGDDGDEVTLASEPTEAVEVDEELAADTISDWLLSSQASVDEFREVPVDVDGHKIVVFEYPASQLVVRQEYGKAQIASWQQDYQVDLIADSHSGKKYALLRPAGIGFHPGTLWQNNANERGYWTQEVSTRVYASDNVAVHAHEPDTTSSSSTYTSSTGFGVNIGFVGPNPTTTLSFSTEDKVSTTISDFIVLNDTTPIFTGWTFQFSKTWEDMVVDPTWSGCDVLSIPAKAKANLNPKWEVLYRWDEAESPWATFEVENTMELRKLRIGSENIFHCELHGEQKSRSAGFKTFSVDFDQVTF